MNIYIYHFINFITYQVKEGSKKMDGHPGQIVKEVDHRKMDGHSGQILQVASMLYNEFHFGRSRSNIRLMFTF